MEIYLDPLGFTKQTDTILRGLGASHLIPECRKRNISTQTLHELSEDDFVRLGADSKQAVELRTAIAALKRRRHNYNFTLEERISHLPEIIQNGSEQSSLIQAFVTYARLRLMKEQVDSFIEPDTPLTASEALVNAVNATLVEVQDLKQNLIDLESVILRVKAKSHPYKRTCVFMRGMSFLIGLSMICIILRRYIK